MIPGRCGYFISQRNNSIRLLQPKLALSDRNWCEVGNPNYTKEASNNSNQLSVDVADLAHLVMEQEVHSFLANSLKRGETEDIFITMVVPRFRLQVSMSQSRDQCKFIKAMQHIFQLDQNKDPVQSSQVKLFRVWLPGEDLLRPGQG